MYHLSPSIQYHRLILSHDLVCLRPVRLKIFSPLWPPSMMDPMLFYASALRCATKLVNALILQGQENLLVLVLQLRQVGFWSLDLSSQLPPMFGPDCGYSPWLPEELSAKTWSNMYTIITCIMYYMLYTEKCKPSNKVANCVFRHKLKKGYEMKLWKAQVKQWINKC